MEIQLPGFVLSDLYKDKIVIISDTKKDVPKQEIPVKDKELSNDKTVVSTKREKFWLGDNLKFVTIVVEDKENVFIGEQELEFLSNILAACKLNLSDVAIVNIAGINTTYEELIAALSSKFLLLFGTAEQDLQLEENYPLLEISKKDNRQILKSPTLRTLMQATPEAKKEKVALWNALKKMFSL